MKKNKKTAAFWAVLCLVMAAGFMAATVKPAQAKQFITQTLAGNQPRTLQSAAAVQACGSAVYAPSRATGPEFDWRHYDVDPYYPNSTDLSSYEHELHVKGNQARKLLGVPAGAWNLLMQQAPCMGRLKQGQKLDKMLSGGFWSSKIKVDKNVRVDFLKKGESVPAWYSIADYNGKRYILVGPTKCGNLSLIVVPAPAKGVTVAKPVIVWVWKYAQQDGKLVNGKKFTYFATGNRNGKHWTMTSGKWTPTAFKAGYVPKSFTEIVTSPWKAQKSAVQTVKLVKGKYEVVFSNYVPSKAAPAPTPVAPPAPPTITITQICSNGQITIVMGNGNTVTQSASQGGNCNGTPPPPVTTTVVTTTTTTTTTPPPPTTTGKCTSCLPPPPPNANGDPTSGGQTGNDPPTGAPGTTIPTDPGTGEPADPQ